jgi:hypothetical protein
MLSIYLLLTHDIVFHTKREQKKLKARGLHSFLTPYREEQLHQVGFDWYIRSPVDSEVRQVVDRSNQNTTVATTAATNGNGGSDVDQNEETEPEKVDGDPPVQVKQEELLQNDSPTEEVNEGVSSTVDDVMAEV